MIYALLAVTVLFCCTVGQGLGSNGSGAWTMVVFSFAAIVALQMSYFAAVVVVHWR